jgi:hypothetical protein
MSQNSENNSLLNSIENFPVVMQDGVPTSVMVSVDEFDKIIMAVAIAEELFEGKEVALADGIKGAFHQVVEQRVAAEKAAYEAQLAAMLEKCDIEDCDEECDQDEQN